MPDARTATISIDAITVNLARLVRASNDEPRIEDYARLEKEGLEFPPIDVFKKEDSSPAEYILVDGDARLEARRQNKHDKVKVYIHEGTSAEALNFALRANATHGKQRSASDKRKVIRLALEQPGNDKKSNREIGRLCGDISHATVADVRNAMAGTLPFKKGPSPFAKTFARILKARDSFDDLGASYPDEHDSSEFKAVKIAWDELDEAFETFRKKVGRKKPK